MQAQPTEEKLSGIVEADESYFGGKPRNGNGRRGRGTNKKPVMVLIERDGNAICNPVPNVQAKTLRAELRAHVDTDSLLMTDEYNAYSKLGQDFAQHETVNHSVKEYARRRGDGLIVHTNTAESFFSLMKRGFYGTFHRWSRKHTHRYCAEFSFRWCHRKTTDTERTAKAIAGISGKRLMYEATDSEA